jgi:hypothetical protein
MTVVMTDCVAEGNGAGGLRAPADMSLELTRFQAINNQGPGIDLYAPKQPGIVSKVAAGVATTIAADYIERKLNIKH